MIMITIMTTTMRTRIDVQRALVLVGLLVIAAGAFQPFYLRVLRQDGRQLSAYLTDRPYRKVPGLRQFCLEVDRRTPLGARILFVAPSNEYLYAFRRARYLLAGKDLLLVGRTETLPEFVACLPRCSVPAGFTVVWRGERGMLLKR